MKADQAKRYLAWVDREIARIRTVVPQWDSASLPPEERMAVRLEWDDVVDRYMAVVRAHDDGLLDAAASTHLLDVSAHLDAFVPTLERLRLKRPDPDVLARLRMAAAG
jgi:hypothetical protein